VPNFSLNFWPTVEQPALQMRNRLMVSLVFLVSVSRQDDFPQRIQLRLAAEQAGLAAADFVQQFPLFAIAAGLCRELVPVLARATNANLFSFAAAAVGQKIKFVFRFINARNLVHQVADLPVYGSTTSVRLCAVGGATAVLGRYCHFGCCNVRLAILRIPQTSPRRASTSCIARDTLFFSSNLSSVQRFPLVRDCLPLLRGPSASVRAKDPICEALQQNRERVVRL
jgi:hypothetical protein